MKLLLGSLAGLLLPLAAADLTFEKSLQEVELPLEGRRVTADFKFENKTDEAVRIAKYNATCSCMTVQVKGGKLAYEPGESGVIRAVFDMGNFSGTVDKALQIWLDGDPEGLPSITLTTRIHIPVLVDIKPKTLRWDVGGEASSQTIEITMKHEDPIRVTSVESVNKHFEVELKTVEEGRKYQMIVTPTDTETQRIGLLSIETDFALKKHAKQRAYTIVRNPSAPIQE